MSELNERYAYYLEEPWGWEIENFRMGQVCATVAQVNGVQMVASEFSPDYQPEEKSAATAEDIESFFRGMCV